MKQEERQKKKESQRTISRRSRAISDVVGLLEPDIAHRVIFLRDSILLSEADVHAKADRLEDLYVETIAMVEAEDVEMSSTGDIDGSPYTNTTRENQSKSNNARPRSNERDSFNADGYAVDSALEEKQCGAGIGSDQPYPKSEGDAEKHGQPRPVSIGLLCAATKETQKIIGATFRDWNDVVSNARMMRIMIGLSEAAWEQAAREIGSVAASAILATVMEKVFREGSEINKPGGYFRAMVERARTGNLYLDRSLFSLAGRALH